MAEDMSAFQRATISLKVNGNDSGLSPMSFSVIEFDSIYQFYPKVKLVVSDYEGIANEYLAFVNVLFGSLNSALDIAEIGSILPTPPFASK